MINDLIPVFGERFLTYVLAIDADGFPPERLSTPQQAIVESLRRLAFGAVPDEAEFDRHSRLAVLGQWNAESQTSLPNVLRAQCGGALPALPPQPDRLLTSLQEVARDAWPAMLLPSPQQGPRTFWSAMPIVTFDHPQALAAAKAFLEDDSLRCLFPHGPAGRDLDHEAALRLSSFWISGLGGMANHELLPLMGFLITNARLWGLVEHGSDTLDGLLDALPQVVNAMRGLAIGQIVGVPQLIGFRGASLSAGVEIALSSGRLCAPRSLDRSFLLPAAETVTMVQVGRFPLRLFGIRPFEPGEQPFPSSLETSDLEAGVKQRQREIDLTRLTVLLASPPEQPWALSQISGLVVDPSAPGGAARGENFGPDNRAAEIEDESASEIATWWDRIEVEFPEGLDIAMRRSLAAAGDRTDPVDGFVDSVVAWENCFGSRSETGFRVTGAIASLLEPESAEARLALQKKLKGIYDKRSRVVHGVLQLSNSEAHELRDDAVRIAVECLRRLVVDHPNLMRLDSSDRGTQLLLGHH